LLILFAIGEDAALQLWRRFLDLSIVKYKEIYGRFNVVFDLYSGESKYSATQMRGVVNKLKELGLLVPSDGAQIIDLNQYKLGAAVIEKRDGGGMLYISRDIAAAIDRQEKYKFDSMYYVVGIQQDHHFKQLFKILELMGLPWAEKCHHISFGMIRTKDGNMSTRKGTVVFLEDILNQVQESMLEVMKKNEAKFNQIEDPAAVSDLVGMTAIMVQDMSARRIKDYAFDWDRVFAFEGDTGPYLQYAHARLCSIERMANVEVTPTTDLSTLTEPSARALVEVIAMYPDVVREVATSLEPCNTVSYAFRLAHAVMVALENLYVLNQPPEIAAPRLAMYKAARITLGNALSSLGIIPLERM
jgi:arginyl-tRNA synthetase